jgi:hypothetical protein
VARLNRTFALRLALLGASVAFIAAFAASQYDLVRDVVRFLCTSCVGIGD